MPDGPGLELLRGEIDVDAPGAVLATSFEKERAALIVDADPDPRRARPGCATSRARASASSPASTSPTTCPAEPRFGVHYELLNRERVERIRVKAMLPSESPEIDSCVELFPTANFQEREAFDFFGIVFSGHPELTRILLPEDYVGWPQRRDFPVGGEPVTFTYSEKRYG